MKKRLTLILASLFAFVGMAMAQSINGTVLSAEDNLPIIGASVKVAGDTKGVITNLDGKFSISVAKGTKLEVSYIGMATQTVKASNNMVVLLSADSESLEELVVTGYGGAKKLGSVVGAVNTVNNAKLKTAVTPNFTDALAGQVSGLSVLSSSGDPTTNATIRLRGVNSINSSNAPLYILDGAPVTSSVFNTLNPSDIQSITVLKDAASTAIYGSRAANGVIVITSRKGQYNEHVNMTARAQYGFSMPVQDGIEMMNSEQYIKLRDMIGQPVSQEIKDLVSNYGISTDWRKEVINSSAPTYTFDAAISGGSQNTNYFVSLNHHKQEGIIDQSGMERTTLRTNIETRVNKYFKAGVQTNLGYNVFQQNNEAQSTSSIYLGNPMVFSRMALPYDAPYYYTIEDGKLVKGDRAQKLKYSGMTLPWFINNDRDYVTRRLTLNLNAFEQVNPIEGLTLRAQQALDGYDYNRDNKYFPREAFKTPMGTSVAEETGYTYASFSRYGSYTFTHTAEYKHNFGKHFVSALLGEETIYSRSYGFSVYTEGQTDARQVRLTDGTTVAIANLSDSRAEEVFNSIFGTLSYNYAEKYFLDLSYRRDGSSRFAPESRWGNFWSVGAMWNAKSENFLKNVKWLDQLKLRASYGITGNASGAGSYDYFGLFGTGSQYDGNSSIGISSPSNSKLTWEKVAALNVGVTAGVFDRLTVNLDFYKKKTSDMLMEIPYSFTTGFSGGLGNIGAMTNTGFDADFVVDILKNSEFHWSVKANVNYNKNEITELFAGRDEYIIANTGINLKVGKPYGEFFYVKYAGVDPRDGKPMWYDKNGNKTKVYNEEENSVFTGKQRYAPWSGGFGTTLSWKGLTVTADFAWQGGKYMINNDNYFCKNANFATSYNQCVDMLNIWTTPGQVTDIPAYGEELQFDTHLLENASFLRMKNIIITYNLPAKWMKATNFFKNAKVFAVARNLFTITQFSGYDPEPDINLVKFNYPNTRQFVFGAEVTF